MKKVLTLLMAITYLLLIIGVPVSVHHCHGESEWGVYTGDIKACACSTDQHQHEDKHEVSFVDINTNIISENCSVDHHEMGCCTHEDRLLKWTSDQQLISHFKRSFKVVPLVLNYNGFSELIAPAKKEIQAHWAEAPPQRTLAVQILFQQFIFYG